MFDYSWEEFWWNNITGPHVLVSKVSNALLDNCSVVLSVPEDLPWRHSMRGTIHTVFRERLSSSDIIIEPIDAVDDNPELVEPGKFILSKYASDTINRGYREKSKVSIQEYIIAKDVIKNRVIWVKGLQGKPAEKWIKFCKGFKNRSLQKGLFVLEIQGTVSQNDVNPLELINFKDHVSSYDVQLFNNFVLNEQDLFPDIWKNYISTVAAVVCDTDSEVSAELLNSVDFMRQSVIDGLLSIADSEEYSRRGADNNHHVLWYCRNRKIAEINHRLWKAQMQILFPIIEMERVNFIEKWNAEIQNALNRRNIYQYGERVDSAMDVELGTLCYLMTIKDENNNFELYIPEENDREWVHFLHDCRNSLAHVSICSTEQVCRLLNE